MANRYPVHLAPFSRADRLILADDERVVDFVLIDALRLTREGWPVKAFARLFEQIHAAAIAYELHELLQFVVDPSPLAPETTLEVARETPDNVLTYLRELSERPETEPVPDNAVVLGVEPGHELRIRQKEGQPTVQLVTRGALRDVVGVLYHTDSIEEAANSLGSTTAGLSSQKLVNIASALCRMVRPAMATVPLEVEWSEAVLRLVLNLWHEVRTGTLTTLLDYDGEDFRGSRGDCQWTLSPGAIKDAMRMLRRLDIVSAIKHLRAASEAGLKEPKDTCDLLRSVRPELTGYRVLDGQAPLEFLGETRGVVEGLWAEVVADPKTEPAPEPEPLSEPEAYLKDLFAEAAEIPTTPATPLVYRFEPSHLGLFCVEAEMSICHDTLRQLVGILQGGGDQLFLVAYDTLALREPWLPVGACRALLEFLSDVDVGIQQPHYTAHSGAWSLVAGLCGKEA